MSDKILRPCPFCGGKAVLKGGELHIEPIIDENGAYIDADVELIPSWVECTKCHATGQDFDKDDKNAENAIKAWNRRAGNSDVIERIKQRINEKIDRLIEFDRILGTVSDDTTFKMIGLQRAKNFIDEEVAKEPNLVQDSTKVSPSLVQDSEQKIIRTPEEIAETMESNIECEYCNRYRDSDGCKQYWIDWLTGKGD